MKVILDWTNIWLVVELLDTAEVASGSLSHTVRRETSPSTIQDLSRRAALPSPKALADTPCDRIHPPDHACQSTYGVPGISFPQRDWDLAKPQAPRLTWKSALRVWAWCVKPCAKDGRDRFIVAGKTSLGRPSMPVGSGLPEPKKSAPT